MRLYTARRCIAAVCTVTIMMPEPRGPEGAIGRWLVLLRDGSEEEQQLARTELGLILEARGLLDDAAEAYERNVADGVSDRRPYERLAALALARGDRETEARALRALADLLAPPPPPPPPPLLAPERPPDPPVVVETEGPAASEVTDLTEIPGELDSAETSVLPTMAEVPAEAADLPDAESEPESEPEPE